MLFIPLCIVAVLVGTASLVTDDSGSPEPELQPRHQIVYIQSPWEDQ